MQQLTYQFARAPCQCRGISSRSDHWSHRIKHRLQSFTSRLRGLPNSSEVSPGVQEVPVIADRMMKPKLVEALDANNLQLSPLEAWQQGKLSFGFSAGGLCFPYFIGCCMALRDLGLLHGSTQVAGASAGSLIAACAKSGLSLEDVLTACLLLATDCRSNGTRFRLRQVLQQTLDVMLPADVHERCSGTVHVAVTQISPKFKPMLINQYESRADFMEALLTSCHIPWYMDGSLFTNFRQGVYSDGGLTNFLPKPPGTMCVTVCCFPVQQMSGRLGAIAIAPDLHGDKWPHTMREMLGWAFEAAPEETLLKLVRKGEADALAWAAREGFPIKPSAELADMAQVA